MTRSLMHGNIIQSGVIEVKKRIALILIFTVILFSVLYFASILAFSDEELKTLMREAEEILKRRYTVLDIFLNNFLISLIMFIPVAGPLVGGYIIYVTGRVIGVVANSTGVPSILLISLTILTFYGLLEFLAYGTAFTESILLTYSIFRRNVRRESRWILISLGATALLLLLAATIEYLLIQFFGQIYPDLEGFTSRI
ncbi:MAG: hypothetical protein ABDH32_00680 [Candidatus Caldarchaeales archaeon]